MSETKQLRQNVRILVLNPNSSTVMTGGMGAAIRKIDLPSSLEIYTYTAPPDSPASIDNQEDIDASAKAVLEDPKIAEQFTEGKYDAVLVACFSVHNLVRDLTQYDDLAVTGIFEASVLTALSLIPAAAQPKTWGIVTTGKFWEKHLSDGVKALIGQEQTGTNNKFAGVFSTGLTAGDFHSLPPEEIKAKIKETTKKLLAPGNVSCVVMGCGGMAGLEDIIRSTAIELYGDLDGSRLYIIDGVKAGILQLEQTIRSKRAFR
ncbi:hypothetical protein G7046_g3503 [Stylonectria norvegica]|nr:hypothetical protein G7046_g3503 [Stylonectria norvegica]